MSNILNAKPRFGLYPGTDRMIDYLTGKDVAISASHQSLDGVWDLEKVRDAILAGQLIESARLSTEVPKASNVVALAKKPAPPAPGAAVPVATSKSLTAEELKGLGLTMLQHAALGITPEHLKVRGLTSEEIQALAMTPERGRKLGLNAAQLAALSP